MKRKNTLIAITALALCAQLAVPAAFAEDAADTAAPAAREELRGKDFKDDIIFAGDGDEERDTDKPVMKCIAFGAPGGGFKGHPGEEPPAKPDGETEQPGEEPPAKPDGETEQPGEEPPAKPDGETEQPGEEPPAKPDGETEQGADGNRPWRRMGPRYFDTENTETADDADNRPELPERPADADALEIAEGDSISITDADGTVLYSFTAEKAAKGVMFASGELEEGVTYTLSVNGEAVATSELHVRGQGKAPDGEQNADGAENMPAPRGRGRGEAPAADGQRQGGGDRGQRPPMPPTNNDTE